MKVPYFNPIPPPSHWTKITIADSQHGEVSITVREIDMTLYEVIERLFIPALQARGYGTEELMERLERNSQ